MAAHPVCDGGNLTVALFSPPIQKAAFLQESMSKGGIRLGSDRHGASPRQCARELTKSLRQPVGILCL